MTKTPFNAERVSQYAAIFKCPVCGGEFAAAEPGGLVCGKGHRFDMAKPGYVNFLSRAVNSGYGKELFAARHRIITESSLYAPLHEVIADAIRGHSEGFAAPPLIADMGCGEGSHLHEIMNRTPIPGAVSVGLDLSKEGIRMAARRYAGPVWAVGDLARAPLPDQAAIAILNMLSPANYREFKRMLAPSGIVVKVVPGPQYLQELRRPLFDGEEKRSYSNDKTASLFRWHFRLKETVALQYTRLLLRPELACLARMTPLAWSAEPARTAAFADREAAEITVDLEVWIGASHQ
ncbi:putative RNA methyltransferase [Paenibacillus macerans]|uniref:putative RNA methyltransferase n=1 Tax=Paenibacillus macerans TaxID=44252 RepID=UPI003D31E7E7